MLAVHFSMINGRLKFHHQDLSFLKMDFFFCFVGGWNTLARLAMSFTECENG
jgi:hypothetical protein